MLKVHNLAAALANEVGDPEPSSVCHLFSNNKKKKLVSLKVVVLHEVVAASSGEC